jgi:hypothetical protein
MMRCSTGDARSPSSYCIGRAVIHRSYSVPANIGLAWLGWSWGSGGLHHKHVKLIGMPHKGELASAFGIHACDTETRGLR